MFWKLHDNGSSMVPSKQFIKFLLTVWPRPKDDNFSQFWKKISQKRLQRIFFRAPRIFSQKMRSCCYMTKRYVKGFGQQLQNKRVRDWYVPTIFGHSEVENVGHLWSEPYIYIHILSPPTHITSIQMTTILLLTSLRQEYSIGGHPLPPTHMRPN